MMGDADDPEDDDYEVGYGRPPVEHQFRKGAPSPNPKGRPPISRDRKAVIRRIAFGTREYTEGGKRRRATTLELIALVVRNAAASGVSKALDLMDQYTGEGMLEHTFVATAVLIVPETIEDFDEWYRKYAPPEI